MLTNLPYEILNQLFLRLDPLSLYCIAFANKFLYSSLFNNKSIGENLLLSHFQLKTLTNRHNDYFSLFKDTFDEYYNKLNAAEIQIFTLVRANNLSAIKNKKIKFTIDVLIKRDAKGNSLLSLIRGTNNRDLFQYIFAYISDGIEWVDDRKIKLQLIKCGIELDMDDDNEVFKNLLISEQNIDNIFIDEKPLLILAAKNNSLHTVKLLFDLNADPNITDNDGFFPLFIAADCNYLDLLDLLLGNDDIEVNKIYIKEDNSYYTSLYTAAYAGHLDAVKRLVEKKATINQVANEGNALYIAVQQGRRNIVDYLLAHDANSNYTFRGFSLLYVGAYRNRLECIKLIIAHRIKYHLPLNLNENSGDGSTPLYVAAQEGHAEVCRYLLSLGAQSNTEFPSKFFYTPLNIAVENHHVEVVKVLLENKNNLPNINYIPSDGMSSLLIAVKKGYVDIVELLVQQNSCDVNLRNAKGETPLRMVCANHDIAVALPIITALIRAGADPAAYSLKGKSVASVAKDKYVKKIISRLEEISKSEITNIISTKVCDAVNKEFILKAILTFTQEFCKDKTNSCVPATHLMTSLLGTFTPFGCVVVLYSFLERKLPYLETNLAYRQMDSSSFDQQELFMQCIIKALGFSSQEEARNSLYSMILASMPEVSPNAVNTCNELLFEKLKVTVLVPLQIIFSEIREVRLNSLTDVMLCLNLFEAQVKKTTHLMAQQEGNITDEAMPEFKKSLRKSPF